MRGSNVVVGLLAAFVGAALVWDVVLYWPASVASDDGMVQRFLLVAIVGVPIFGIWKGRRWAWEAALLVTGWFALLAGSHFGVIVMRAVFDDHPYRVGDALPHALVLAALVIAVTLLLTPGARTALRTGRARWNND